MLFRKLLALFLIKHWASRSQVAFVLRERQRLNWGLSQTNSYEAYRSIQIPRLLRMPLALKVVYIVMVLAYREPIITTIGVFCFPISAIFLILNLWHLATTLLGGKQLLDACYLCFGGQ